MHAYNIFPVALTTKTEELAGLDHKKQTTRRVSKLARERLVSKKNKNAPVQERVCAVL